MKHHSMPRLFSSMASIGMCLMLLLSGCTSSQTAESKPVQQASLSSTPVPPANTPIPATPTPVIPVVKVPPAPAALAIPTGSPQEQAAALAKAVRSDSPNRLAAWLTVYSALGIPVLGANRTPLGKTGDDPVGPPFWRVWYMSGMTRPGAGFRLTDLTKTLNSFGEPSYDNKKAGAILLEDIRKAVASKDPQVQLFGRFTVEMVKRGPSPVDLLDPKVTADTVVITGDVAELLSWVVTRDFVFSLAQTKNISTGDSPDAIVPVNGDNAPAIRNIALTEKAPSTQLLSLAGEQQGCTSMVDEDSTYWLNWALSKIVGGGVKLPGMSEATKGLVEYVQLARDKTKLSTIEKVKSITGIAGTVANVLTLAMQISALTLDSSMEPIPLERTHDTSDGKQATINFRLTYDPGSLPDGKNLSACVSSYMLNAFGVSLSFPASGRIAGAELTFEGGKGFGQYVLFGDYKQLRTDTDMNGEVALLVLGKGQKKAMPASAQPVGREFSLFVRGQPEAETANSIANTFFDSLTFWADPTGAGLVNAGVDIAKVFHWDLGEFVYPLTDWASGFKVDQPYGDGGRVSGTICSFDNTFILQFSNPAVQMVGTFTFTPAGGNQGTWKYAGNAMGGTVTNAGAGNFSIEGVADGTPLIKVGVGEWNQTTVAGTYRSPASPVETITLEPAEGGCQ